MGYSAEHTARTRARILSSAARLFRRHGFQGVGIDEIMAGAGLTRGGFYAHFKSKEDLFRRVFEEEELEFEMRLRSARAARGVEGALAAVDYYLAPGNRKRIARGCTLVANAPDIARASLPARRAFTEAFESLAGEFEALLAEGLAEAEPERAFAALATCVGGVSLARNLTDEALAERMLEACKRAVLDELGHGESTGAERTRKAS